VGVFCKQEVTSRQSACVAGTLRRSPARAAAVTTPTGSRTLPCGSRLSGVEDTWDLPVLDATVRPLETAYYPKVSDIAAAAGLDIETTARSLEPSMAPTWT
jgi:hypothetical protein